MQRVRTTYMSHPVTLLSALWPPQTEADELRGFSAECPYTIDSFLEQRNAKLLPAFKKVPAMPGAARLIQHLSSHNIPICVRRTRAY